MGRLSPIEQLASFATGDIQIGQQGKPKTALALGMEAVGTGSLQHCWISPSLGGGEAVKKNARQTSAKDRLDQESPNTVRGICSPGSSSASGPSLPIPQGDSQVRQRTHNPSLPPRGSLAGCISPQLHLKAGDKVAFLPISPWYHAAGERDGARCCSG